MGAKKMCRKLLACVISACCLFGSVAAADMNGDSPVNIEVVTVQDNHGLSVTRATRTFNMDISAGGIRTGDPSFPLEAGEVVTIKASYSPFSASVDFGLIAPDGMFHFINVTDGSIDESIEVDERGTYTFAVRNNSSKEITVSGFLNY